VIDHIVMFSGGIGSWCTACRVKDQLQSGDRLYLIFADTLIEDYDLYRFLDEAAEHIGGELIKLTDGRTPWEVFKDERHIGNSRIDPCSKILKRKLIRSFVDEHFDSENCIIYVGIDWTEVHRIQRIRDAWSPFIVKAPLMNKPYLSKQDILQMLLEAGLKPPRLYAMGFPHNNCGGFCIKAGMTHFLHLLKTMPERYLFHEAKEEELRQYLDKDVSILRDRRNKRVTPLTLRELRRRYEEDGFDPKFNWGGCGCFTD
jgi:hypothetical protein